MRKLSFAVLAVLCLVAGYGFAQTEKKDTPPPQQLEIQMPKPVGLNDDLAFRVEGMHDGRVIGTLLVKVDGRWVEASFATKNMRVGH